MAERKNPNYDLRGINHIALVCKDMGRTVDFYTNVLGMPLIKTLELPNGMGQHFFFDCGGGNSVAFFWFPNAPAAAPGVASTANLVSEGDIATCHGSMNHLAFDVSPEAIDEYHDRLVARGVHVTQVVNHDDTPTTSSPEINETTFVRSLYFFDPDGIQLEFAAWTREFNTTTDVQHAPADASGERKPIRVPEPAE
jgi:catechol 2,3-dioxygenase-like lactoylglutathione lyase family enzyme